MRGGVYAVPSGQWEAAQALGLRHGQALRYVIIPQTLPSLAAPWMNLYCAVIVKKVDAQTRSKTSINELLRD